MVEGAQPLQPPIAAKPPEPSGEALKKVLV